MTDWIAETEDPVIRKTMKRNKNMFRTYIERQLCPIKAEKEAYHLSRKCGVSIEDAQLFLWARQELYTDIRTDAEFIICDNLTEIERNLNVISGLSRKKISSLLYHSDLYRREKGKEREEYRTFFPTAYSYMEMDLEKEGDRYDAKCD